MKNKYEIRGDVTVIFMIAKGRIFEALVDTNDLEFISKFPNTWKAHIQKIRVYVEMKIREEGKNRYHRLHRLLLNCPDGYVVDHINHNTLDNRRSNLRIVTHAENLQNIKGPRISKMGGYAIGVFYNKRDNFWQTSIWHNNTQHHLGYYNTHDEAKLVSQKARALLKPFSLEARTVPIDLTGQIEKHILSVVNSESSIKRMRVYLKPRTYRSRKDSTSTIAMRTSKTGIRGIMWNHRKNLWHARIRKGKKTVYEKHFKDLEIAKKELQIARSFVNNAEI